MRVVATDGLAVPTWPDGILRQPLYRFALIPGNYFPYIQYLNMVFDPVTGVGLVAAASQILQQLVSWPNPRTEKLCVLGYSVSNRLTQFRLFRSQRRLNMIKGSTVLKVQQCFTYSI